MSSKLVLSCVILVASTAGCSAEQPNRTAPTASPQQPQPAEAPRTAAELSREYEKAYELGHPRSWVLKHGSEHAADWKARAEAGDADAALLYSLALDAGAGVEPSPRAGTVWLEKAADGKQRFAMFKLAKAHIHSKRVGIVSDRATGLSWLTKSAEADCDEARLLWLVLSLGSHRDAALSEPQMKAIVEEQLKGGNTVTMRLAAELHHREVLGYERDPEASLQWLKRAAASKSTYAMLDLGTAYLEGRFGCKTDPAEAVRWFDRAVENGGSDARFAVALQFLDNPEGIDRAKEEALKLLEEAADAGDLDALRTLGLQHGIGGHFGPNVKKGLAYLRRSADRGDAAAMIDMARYLLLQFDPDRAVMKKWLEESHEWLEKSASKDDTNAMMELFTRHTQGRDAEKDEQKGLAWLRDAVRLKDGKALYRLAEVYAKGQFGVRRDPKEAEKVLREGASLGSADCMYELGYAMLSTGTALDFIQQNNGYHMLKQAAELGHAEAQYRMGLAHASGGRGVVKDVDLARAWLKRAAKQGHAAAKAALAELK